jgi:hypothetical protein
MILAKLSDSETACAGPGRSQGRLKVKLGQERWVTPRLDLIAHISLRQTGKSNFPRVPVFVRHDLFTAFWRLNLT